MLRFGAVPESRVPYVTNVVVKQNGDWLTDSLAIKKLNQIRKYNSIDQTSKIKSVDTFIIFHWPCFTFPCQWLENCAANLQVRIQLMPVCVRISLFKQSPLSHMFGVWPESGVNNLNNFFPYERYKSIICHLDHPIYGLISHGSHGLISNCIMCKQLCSIW